MSHFSGSSHHHDGGDRDQTPRPGPSFTPPPVQNYEVFLSFRGEDTRHGFTDHLYHGLNHKGIVVFRDNEELPVGEKIERLLEAIKVSKISVPIISADYASSMWCLRELLQIIECNKTSGQLVLPIFYKVKPSDVREQKGDFGKKFRLFRKTNNLDGKFVQDLQNAFEQVASMKGWESEKIANGYEGALVNMVVGRIFNELNKHILSVPDLLVGVDERIEAIKEKFDAIPSNNAKIIAIHGMGGIGKTTLAKALYNEFSESFECRSFVSNIREASSNYKGMEGLQKQLISDILGDKSVLEISHVDQGKAIIKERFKGKRLLLLLDDVDNRDQLDQLAVENHTFGPESIVNITTRDQNIAAAPSVNLSYELNELTYDQSYKLFCKHAFGIHESCPKDLEVIATNIVRMTGGLPLAIEVIGSLLYGKGESFWKDTEEKLRGMPNRRVHDKLKISYDALDYAQQQIFLDIACIPGIAYNFNYASYMWKSCGFYPGHDIPVLVSLSLIKVVDGDRVVMHDLLKELGREIVREESRGEIGKRSRIWSTDEAAEVLEGKQGTKNIQALVLDHHLYKSEHFEGMDNLRFLHVEWGDLIGDFEDLIPNLRWFHWRGQMYCTIDFMGINFNPKKQKLVILDLWRSNISEYWKGWSQMKDLRFINISFCNELTTIPDLSALNGLEVLTLDGCSRLKTIHPSIGKFSKTLKTLIVRWCELLEELPLEVRKMEELRELDISATGIKEIPISDGYIQKMKTLDASYCRQFISIPDSIGKLKLLTTLNLYNTEVTQLPDSIGDLYDLKELRINHTPIKCFPTSFGKLSKLVELDLQGCRKLESLSNLPCNLRSLKFHGDSMETLTDISNLTILKHLTYLDLFEKRIRVLNVGKLNQLESLTIKHSEWSVWQHEHLDEEVSGSQEELEISNPAKEMDMAPENFTLLLDLPLSLVKLEVFGCQTLRTLTSLSDLKNLSSLCLVDCSELEESDILEGAELIKDVQILRCGNLSRIGDLSNLKMLKELRLDGCEKLSDVEGMQRLTSLTDLCIIGCNPNIKIPNLSMLRNLEYLRIRDAELVEIPWLQELKSLTGLLISSKSLQYLPDLSHLTKLSLLDISGSEKLIEIRGIGNMKSLMSLYIEGCTALKKLPDLPNVHIQTDGSFDRMQHAPNTEIRYFTDGPRRVIEAKLYYQW